MDLCCPPVWRFYNELCCKIKRWNCRTAEKLYNKTGFHCCWIDSVFERCPFQPWCAAICLGSNQKVIFIADKKERDRKPINFTSCGFLGLCQTPTVDSFPSAITTALTWISQHFWNSPPVRLQSMPSKYFQDYRSPPCPASKTSCCPLWGRYYDHVPRVWGAFCFGGVV